MPEIDVERFETRVHLRPLTLEDYEAVVALQELCFPRMPTWGRDQFRSQIEHFPEGQLCIEIDGRLVASSSSLIVDFDLHSDWHDWRSISDSGYIRNHDPEGDTLYGIELMVHPDHRGMRLARRLYDARKQLCRERNLKGIVLGGRIPGYAAHSAEMSAHEYAAAVEEKRLADPVLTAQLANDFELRQLIPDYLPSDEDSAGWATHLEWTNVDYRPFKKRSVRPVQVVRLSVVQYKMRAIDSFAAFEQQCEFFVDTSADYKSDFVLFPELFTTQLLSLVDARRPGEAARKLAEYTPRYLELFSDLAVRCHVNIVGGSSFVVEGDTLYNVAFLFRRDGTIEKQYKIHITTPEWKWWGVTGGDRLDVFDTDCGRIAILICYDIEFPELARIAAKKGAQIFFVPFNTDERFGYLRVRSCAMARCIENHVYVAMSGCVGNLPLIANADLHYAQSGVFTPADIPFSRDAVAAECTPNIETLVIQDIDIEMLRKHKYRGSTLNWRDRRTDIYSVRWTEDGREQSV